MTVKEWAKEYPEIAATLFNCSVDDLDRVLEEKSVDTDDNEYLTKADIDELMKILNT